LLIASDILELQGTYVWRNKTTNSAILFSIGNKELLHQLAKNSRDAYDKSYSWLINGIEIIEVFESLKV